MEYGTSMSIYGGRAVEGRRGSRVAVAAATLAGILTCLALLLPRGPAARDREQLLQKLHGNIILRNDQAILSQTHYLYPPAQGSMPFAAQEWAGNAPAARDNLPQRSELLHRRPVVHPMGYYQNVPGAWTLFFGSSALHIGTDLVLLRQCGMKKQGQHTWMKRHQQRVFRLVGDLRR